MLEEISKKVFDYLGLDELPIEFGKISDDSILITKDTAKIVINKKYKGNYIECAKSITHEYRHAFQIYWDALNPDDPMSLIWREELAKAKSTNDDGYEIQAFELDAFAFTQVFLAKEGIKIKHPSKKYQEMIEIYIERYKKYL